MMRENVKYVLEKQLKSIEWMDKLAAEGGINGNTAGNVTDQQGSP